MSVSYWSTIPRRVNGNKSLESRAFTLDLLGNIERLNAFSPNPHRQELSACLGYPNL